MQIRHSDAQSDDLWVVSALLAAIPAIVIAIDSYDCVLAFNEQASELLPSLKAGAPLATFLRSPDVLDAVAKTRATGETARATWLERAPVERFFEVRTAPVAGLTCGPLVVAHLLELSETRRFERMRVDFVANASHELRTPLASLLGFIETLQGPARNDLQAQSRFLRIMRDQAQRMARLVDDLLSLSRVEQHLHLQPKDSVDLSSVLRHIGDTLTPLASDNDVLLEIAVAESIIVPGDRDELLRLAENLIENAIKYGASDAADKRVIVEVDRIKNEAIISVKDFGRGIAPEHLPRLTERFYRVDAGQSRAKGGTGLGLALVKHVAARHRGRLRIESTPGQGSTFYVHLPVTTNKR